MSEYRDTVPKSGEPITPEREPIGFVLGFAVLGAPAAWSLQLLIQYALASHACYPNNVPLSAPLWSFTWWMLIGIELIALIAAGLGMFFSLSKWMEYRFIDATQTGLRRNQYLSRWALLTTSLFSIAIIFTIVMIFIEPICDV
ncbi:MAG TPA: hypothetical protein VFM97_04060 [Gammaproteobacteria bacterium]|nr:hypothetical protein [Gammaproteobacteria bacterium]